MRYRWYDGGRGLTHGLNAGGQSLDPGNRGCALLAISSPAVGTTGRRGEGERGTRWRGELRGQTFQSYPNGETRRDAPVIGSPSVSVSIFSMTFSSCLHAHLLLLLLRFRRRSLRDPASVVRIDVDITGRRRVHKLSRASSSAAMSAAARCQSAILHLVFSDSISVY